MSVSPQDVAHEAVQLVLASAAEKLRTDPEMVAGTLGLTYAGTWGGAHHYLVPAEGFGGEPYLGTADHAAP